MSKIIIVTGGAGFIGSHLTRRLVNEGNRVIVIDNLITTKEPTYIKDLIDGGKIDFLCQDICNPDLISIIVPILVKYSKGGDEAAKVDEIYNLASPASVKLYTTYPMLTFNTSTIGVRNMLNALQILGTSECRFLETSTSEAYGDPLVHPQPETYFGNVNTQCERSCYDEGKRSAEVICYLAHKLEGINTHIARLFNVYGPNNTDDRVMPTFISQAKANKPVTVFGTGNQTRSFCYVDDLVEALIRLQASDEHEPTNLGNPEEITIQSLAEKVIELTQSKSEITYHPLPEFDPTRRCPVIDKAKRVLGWEPTTTLTEGIWKVINWMESQN